MLLQFVVFKGIEFKMDQGSWMTDLLLLGPHMTRDIHF